MTTLCKLSVHSYHSLVNGQWSWVEAGFLLISDAETLLNE